MPQTSKHSFSIGGIHPAPHKESSADPTLLPLPITATIMLSQHIGAPAVPCVCVGEHVERGQEIAHNASFISAGLHAPISGTVVSIGDIPHFNGKPARAMVIKASEDDHTADTMGREQYWSTLRLRRPDRDLSESVDAGDIRRLIAGAGIVGLGGATFPSHVKLTVSKAPEVLIINGCECEPYLMCDDALMQTFAEQVVEGTELMMKSASIPRTVIAIEDNKPAAAAAISAAIDNRHAITLEVLRTCYPQGGEKQLVEAVTGRRIPSGALPASVGAIVHNVATAFAVWQAVADGIPLIERIITVSGDIPAGQRRNYIAAIGTPLSEFPFSLPEHAKIIVGGPMMGHAAVRLDAPVTKGTSGLTLLEGKARGPVQPCMRCGACLEACPMGLEPYLLASYGRLRRWDDAAANYVADCIECGSCSYSCPSCRPLLDYIRLAKQRSKKHAYETHPFASATHTHPKDRPFHHDPCAGGPYSCRSVRAVLLPPASSKGPSGIGGGMCGYRILSQPLDAQATEQHRRPLGCSHGRSAGTQSALLAAMVDGSCRLGNGHRRCQDGFRRTWLQHIQPGAYGACVPADFFPGSHGHMASSRRGRRRRSTGATILTLVKTASADPHAFAQSDLALGNMPGSMGEVSAVALLLGFAYLLVTKVIRADIPFAVIAGLIIVDFLAGYPAEVDILSGGLLLGAIFMATDYSTSPMTRMGMLVYGLAIGAITACIRRWGAYPEGMSFAILLMNGATPLINRYFKPERFSIHQATPQ